MRSFSKNKIALLMCAVIWIVTCSIPAFARVEFDENTNLLFDGGFESKGYEYWKQNTSNQFYTQMGTSWGADRVRTGEGSLLIHTATYYHHYIQQTVSVEKNTKLLLSYWYKGYDKNLTTEKHKLRVYGENPITYTSKNDTNDWNVAKDAIVDRTFNDASDWTEVQIVFNTGNNEELTIRFLPGYMDNSTGKGTSVDDVYLGVAEPYAENVVTDGYAVVGNNLKAYATIIDPVGDELEDPLYRWQISDGEDGVWEYIPDAEGNKYTVRKSDSGKYIRVAVAPVLKLSESNIKYCREAYSAPILVDDSLNNIPVSLDKYFTGRIIGTEEESAEITDDNDKIDGYILNSDSLKNKLNQSNAFVVGDTKYSLILRSDKRAVRSGATDDDLTISLDGQNFSAMNVLMTYTEQPVQEQKAVISYSDGTNEEFTYKAGLIKKSDYSLSIANDSPLGLLGTEDYGNDESAGYLYSYSFDVNPEKELDAITFPYASTEDKMLLFAISGVQVSGDVIKTIIENKINSLPDKLNESNRSEIEKILSYAEIYESSGNDPYEIPGYTEISQMFTDIENCTAYSGLCDFVFNVRFKNPVKSDSLSYDTVKINNFDSSMYEIEPVMENDEIVGAEITVINYFDYPELILTIDNGLVCANEPNFTLGYDYSFSYIPEKLFEVVNAQCTLTSGTLKAKATLINNSEEEQSYYLICAVYSDANEMIYSFVQEGILGINETALVNKNVVIEGAGATAKMFVWNSTDAMQIIYQ